MMYIVEEDDVLKTRFACAMRDVLGGCSLLTSLEMDFSMQRAFADDVLIPCLRFLSAPPPRLAQDRGERHHGRDDGLSGRGRWPMLESLWVGSKRQQMTHTSIIRLLRGCPELREFSFDRGGSDSINDAV